MLTPKKPQFIWSGNDHYQRCIIEDMCIMLTIHKENFGFYQGKMWVNNELCLIERAHPKEKIEAVLEHAVLELYLGIKRNEEQPAKDKSSTPANWIRFTQLSNFHFPYVGSYKDPLI